MTEPGARPLLQRGDTGAPVAELQHRLRALRLYDGELDGCLGERTLAAVGLLRTHAGAPCDGPVDDSTWQLLELLERTAEVSDPFADAAESDEGRWRWDGDRWQPAGAGSVADPQPAVFDESEEHWEWDGERWRSA